MKRLIILTPIIAIFFLCMFEACKKESNPSRVAPISNPTITLNGPADTTLSRGATWTDPGASWKDTVTGESGTVYAVIIQANYTRTAFKPNTSVDTVYLLNYIALNKNGFASPVVTRGLGVTNYNGDISKIVGNYVDTISGIPAATFSTPDSLYQVAASLIYNPNADGQGTPGVMVIKSDGTIAVSTVYTSALTGAYIPEWFTPTSISTSTPVTFTVTGNPLNVPAGGGSAYGLPMAVPVTFIHQ